MPDILNAKIDEMADLTLDERKVLLSEEIDKIRRYNSDTKLAGHLDRMAAIIEPINGNSTIRDWVSRIGRRHQGVLLSAMRGCDLAPRHDPSKIAQRLLRAAVLVPHGGRFANPKTYITVEPDAEKWREAMAAFLSSWDHYPNHYVVHFIHACEIVGYHGPHEFPVFGERFENFYLNACLALHVNPETREQLDARLLADNEKFLAAQELMRGGLLTHNID
jgi:hypothetical protein